MIAINFKVEMKQSPIGVFLISPPTQLHRLLLQVIEAAPNLYLVGESSSSQAAIDALPSLGPAVFVWYMQSTLEKAQESIQFFLQYAPNIKLLLTNVPRRPSFVQKWLATGIHGYLAKGATLEELLHAIRYVDAGQRYVSPPSSTHPMLSQTQGSVQLSPTPFAQLSKREMQVVFRIVSGQSINAIAKAAGIHPKTISTYRYRIFEKLQIDNDVQLTYSAIQYGLIQLPILVNDENRFEAM